MSAAAGPPEDAEPVEQLSFTDLPSSLQHLVFALAASLHQAALRAADGQEQALALRRLDPRRVLPLVCRAWLAAAADADVLWRRVQLNLLTLTAETVPLFASWLHRHAAAVRCLVLYGRALPTVMAALDQHVDALAAALQAASGLQQLELSRALAAPLLARIDPLSLPRLQTVSVDLASSSSGSGSRGGSALRQRHGSSGGVSELEAATLSLLSLPALSELAIQSAIEVRGSAVSCAPMHGSGHPASRHPAPSLPAPIQPPPTHPPAPGSPAGQPPLAAGAAAPPTLCRHPRPCARTPAAAAGRALAPGQLAAVPKGWL